MLSRDEQIGEAVRRVRGDMPQAALAAAMVDAGHEKWSQSTVWAVEKGTRPLRLAEAESLATVLECSLSTFTMSPEVANRILLGNGLVKYGDKALAGVESLLAQRLRILSYVEVKGVDLESFVQQAAHDTTREWMLSVLRADEEEVGRRLLTRASANAARAFDDVEWLRPDPDPDEWQSPQSSGGGPDGEHPEA